jgi:hypothetical protein
MMGSYPKAFSGNMSYDSIYNQPASLAAIAGNYQEGSGCGGSSTPPDGPGGSLPILSISGSNLTVLSPDGQSTIMTGTLTPHGTVNVFDVSLTATTAGGITPLYGSNNAPIPAGTVFKGILFQTSDSPGDIEIVATAGNDAYFYGGSKQN